MTKHGQVVITSLILSRGFNGINYSGFTLMIYCIIKIPGRITLGWMPLIILPIINTLVWPNVEQIIHTEFLEKPCSIHKSLVCEGCMYLPNSFSSFLGVKSFISLWYGQSLGVSGSHDSLPSYMPKPGDAVTSLVMANQTSPECYQPGGERKGYKSHRVPTWLGAKARTA